MTQPVSSTNSAAAQAYQAICAAATTTATNNASGSAGKADSAFSSATATDALTGTASNSGSLNSSLLGALLGMNSDKQMTGSPNSATTSPNNGSAASGHHHHGISAYIAQLASAAGRVAGSGAG
jgi:hypothetical protein